jgi:hypothetical protein
MITRSRYDNFISDGKCEYIPFITIPKQTSDYYVIFDSERMRMDILSYQYYNNPNYGWIILQANPEYGSLEFAIPSGSVLRIPYPLENVLSMYNENIKKYRQIYGSTK